MSQSAVAANEAYYDELMDEMSKMPVEAADKPKTVRVEGVYGTLGGNTVYSTSDMTTYNVTGAGATALVN